MPYGYNGKILRVDLTTGAMKTEEPGEALNTRRTPTRGKTGMISLDKPLPMG